MLMGHNRLTSLVMEFQDFGKPVIPSLRGFLMSLYFYRCFGVVCLCNHYAAILCYWMYEMSTVALLPVKVWYFLFGRKTDRDGQYQVFGQYCRGYLGVKDFLGGFHRCMIQYFPAAGCMQSAADHLAIGLNGYLYFDESSISCTSRGSGVFFILVNGLENVLDCPGNLVRVRRLLDS